MKSLFLILSSSLLLLAASAATAATTTTCEDLCRDFLAKELNDDSCRGALLMDPRPTTYNACKKGREKGFKDACIPTCNSHLLGVGEEDEGSKSIPNPRNPKPDSFKACDGSKNKKRRPNNPFARCRRAYEVAFEETQKGITERAKAALASALEEIEADEGEEADEVKEVVALTATSEDTMLREPEDPEEDRPTPFQVPPTDTVVEEAIEPEPKSGGVNENEDVAVVKSATNVAEAVVEEPANPEAALVDETNEPGPTGSEGSLDQSDARANGPTGPAANDEPPKEVVPTDDDTAGPSGSESLYPDSPPGMNGPAETTTGSDNDDDVDDGIGTNATDSSTPRNHVSVDLEKSPIVDL